MLNQRQLVLITMLSLGVVCGTLDSLVAQNRYATSDNMSGYVHWIDLYDADNNRIDPTAEFPRPYSPERTCGRCHEFDTIAHGWHFNAVDPQAAHGRPGQPWIWSDPRSGTHLPLSYRNWQGTYNPDVLGLSRWEVAAKLGGFLPGGGPGSSAALAESPEPAAADPTEAAELAERDRSQITGPLPIDCLLCHHKQGSGYSPFAWTEQVKDQNFAYAPTVALGLGEVNGTMARLKEVDPTAADAASKLPKLTYETERFRSDGKVFVDLVRKPQNNACYYCHTNVTSDALTGSRWLHDEDVHLRAGLACADCHRNGLEHHTVRGYEGEQHPAGSLIASLSCQGCHLGDNDAATDPLARAGRMGAPQPRHAGLPTLHFEKLSCTACHSGPLPEQAVGRQINSIAHHLGEHIKRTGEEHPVIVGPVNLPIQRPPQSSEPQSTNSTQASGTDQPEAAQTAAAQPVSGGAPLETMAESGAQVAKNKPEDADAHLVADQKYTPHRLLWPSFWGILENGQATPLNPETAYELVRKPLKVRRDFTEELGDVSLSLTQRKELLGDERARVKEEERTAEEQTKIRDAESIARQAQINERLLEALVAIEEKYPGKQAVYVTGGTGWIRYGDDKVKTVAAEELGTAAEPYAWPLAHNVRPARQSLGASGCTECHSDDSKFFFADIQPVGLVPDQEIAPLKVHQLQQADLQQLLNWNKLFVGRDVFKIASLLALSITCLITFSALAWNIGAFWQRRA